MWKGLNLKRKLYPSRKLRLKTGVLLNSNYDFLEEVF